MSARPKRATAKGVSYKIKALRSDGEESGEEDRAAEEACDDDSDEYVEPPPAKDGDDGKDDNEDLEADEDEDDESFEVEEEEDSGSKRPKRGSSKKRALLRDVDLDSLMASDHADETTFVSAHGMGFTKTTLVDKMAPIKSTIRNSRPTTKRLFHKKGVMHSSDFVPDGWKHAHQAPTSNDIFEVTMNEEVLGKVVYPNMVSNIKDFRVITDTADLDEYLPVLANTKIHTREVDRDIMVMSATYFNTTKSTGLNDFYLLNTGFSVWAMDWCPLPSDENGSDKNRNYLALGGFPDTAENCLSRDQVYPLGKQDSHPNMIQIWRMNCTTDKDGELQGEPDVYLAMCILHSYGAVLDLKWCPTGNYQEAGATSGDLNRLGILVGAFSDGSIRVFNIPEPTSLQDHLGRNTDSNEPETIYIQYPEPYATIRLGEGNFMSINWGTAQRLAAGCTNGSAAVWDMSTLLSQSEETLAEKDSEYLDPIFCPQIHDVSISCIDFLQDPDPEAVPWILVSSGYDGRVRYTDLRDPYTVIEIKTILGVPMASVCVPWAEGVIYVDIDFCAKLDQLYLESRGFRIFNAKGTMWDFSYSDYQPFCAAAVSDGRVKISNPAYKAKRGFGMIQNTIYQIEDQRPQVAIAQCDNDAGDEENSSQGAEGSRNDKEQAVQFLEGEERDYISKSDGCLSFYGANVAVQKVQWSRCLHSAAWLASGSAGGLVRVDNTMLRRAESGANNKIMYNGDSKTTKVGGRGKDKVPRKVKPTATPKAQKAPKTPKAAKTPRKSKKDDDQTKTGQAEDEQENAGDVAQEVESRPKRASRLTVKAGGQMENVAPIFARTLSNASLSRSRAGTEEPAGAHGVQDVEQEDTLNSDLGDRQPNAGPSVEAQSKDARTDANTKPKPKPTPKPKTPSRKKAGGTDDASATPKKRGRPKKIVEPTASNNQSLLTMLHIAAGPKASSKESEVQNGAAVDVEKTGGEGSSTAMDVAVD